MDPLTHTFFGGVLAETGLRRPSAWATATLIIGANLPDVDVLAYIQGSDAALAFRRGHSHGVVAMLVLPALLTLFMLAVDRRRRGRDDSASASTSDPPADARQLLLLSALAVWSHPLLDWLNTYGVRLLMPFDGRWFYGDAFFIVDPWIWLLLGGVLFLARSTSRRALAAWAALGALTTAALFTASGGHGWARWLWLGALVALVLTRRSVALSAPVRRRLARGAVVLVVLYAGAMVSLTEWTTGRVEANLAADGIQVTAPLMVGPERIDPLARLLVVPVEGAYRFGSYHPLRRPALKLEMERPKLEAAGLDESAAWALVERAREAPCVAGLVGWIRYPFYDIERAKEAGEPTRVHLLDARYTRGRTRGFGGGIVVLDEQQVSCDLGR